MSGTDLRQAVYIFIDESGNFDFTEKGSRFLVMTAMTARRPFSTFRRLDDIRHDLLEAGKDITRFHAAHDKNNYRSKILDVIGASDNIEVDALIIKKADTPASYHSDTAIYTHALKTLFRFIIHRIIHEHHPDKLIIITDTLPVNRRRKALEKTIKETLAAIVGGRCEYHIMHHDGASHYGLQAVDYCSWAIFRKYEHAGLADKTWPYKRIQPLIRSEIIGVRKDDRMIFMGVE